MTNRPATYPRAFCAALLSAALVASFAAGQQGGTTRVKSPTIAGGGGASAGGATRVGGTVGQPAAGTSSGGVYTVGGGNNPPTGTQATPTPTPTPTPSPTPQPTPAVAAFQFAQATYGVVEDCASVTLTVTRTGSFVSAMTVDYATQDGTASGRADYALALGTLRFDVGETSKTFDVLVGEDSHVEGAEGFTVALSNPTGGAALGEPATATVEIADDASEPQSNAIDDAQGFVCRHYQDFLGRQPDPAGLAFWTNEITSCGGDAQCVEVKRINVSAAFFLSIEFQETGFLAHRFHKAAYGNLPGLPAPVRLRDFLRDARRLGQGVRVRPGDWQQRLEENKEAYAAEFAARPEFAAAYPAAMTPAAFVDALNMNAGGVLSPAEREQLIADLAGGLRTRAQVLRAVAVDADCARAEHSRAFVLMQYFGYLRRDPDDAPDTNFDGYHFWLAKLNQFNGNFVRAEMARAFIESVEYRARFGQP